MDSLVDKKRIKWDLASIATVVFVFLTIASSYYLFVFVFTRNLFKLAPNLTAFIFIKMHAFFLMMLWSYFKTIFSSPGYLSTEINENYSNVEEIREKQKLILKYKQKEKKAKSGGEESGHSYDIVAGEDLESDPEHIRIKKIALNPLLQLEEIGFCFKCNRVKVPRAHHCKNCKKCVIRMDHHCPWTGNCIGLYNHKFFILFLTYGAVTLGMATLWQVCIYFMDAYKFPESLGWSDKILVQASMGTCFGLCMSLSFLAYFQIKITCKNITTVEHHIKEIFEKNPLDKGTAWNWEEVFGVDRNNWWLPLRPKFKSEEEMFLKRNV